MHHFDQSNKKLNLSFSLIDGSGELSNLRMSSFKNEIQLQNLNSLIFDFVCVDIKLVNAYKSSI